MKNTILLAGSLLFAAPAIAQVSSGTIRYEETLKMELPNDPEAARFANMLPREQHVGKVLHFSETAALYLPEKKKEAEDEAVSGEGGVRMRIRMDVPQDRIYTDLKAGRTIEQRDFMGRKFLVSGMTEKPAWKLTGRQQDVLSYPCQEAVWTTDKDTVTAWFTTAIPVSAGPDGWTGLPGMILEGTRNRDYEIKAVAVTPGPADEKVLVQPKEGKKVTKEEFRSIVDAKRRELREQFGGNGNVIIRVQNN